MEEVFCVNNLFLCFRMWVFFFPENVKLEQQQIWNLTRPALNLIFHMSLPDIFYVSGSLTSSLNLCQIYFHLYTHAVLGRSQPDCILGRDLGDFKMAARNLLRAAASYRRNLAFSTTFTRNQSIFTKYRELPNGFLFNEKVSTEFAAIQAQFNTTSIWRL